jgi:hypothetical protein
MCRNLQGQCHNQLDIYKNHYQIQILWEWHSDKSSRTNEEETISYNNRKSLEKLS